MHGRTAPCLLALALLISAPEALSGQTDRTDPGREAAFSSLAGNTIRFPAREPGWPDPGLPRPIAPGTFGLPQLTRAAGMIFFGTATRIRRRPGTAGPAFETVAITFHVEKAIRGATPGRDVTVSQWIGLWSAGQRYRMGERALLFLYPPSKLGLTSCVGGPIGRFSMDPRGWVQFSAQQISAFRRDPVLGGKSRVRFSDFVRAVRQAGEEE
jgi:hypothetical protein